MSGYDKHPAYEPSIGLAGMIVVVLIIAMGLAGAFGWMLL